MKSILILLIPSLRRLTIALALCALLISTTSCGKREKTGWLSFGKKESACESAFSSLETKFEDLKAQLTGGKTSAEKAADRAARWQAVAAFLVVLSGFALVFGAGLGSRARREQTIHDRSTPSITGNEVAS